MAERVLTDAQRRAVTALTNELRNLMVRYGNAMPPDDLADVVLGFAASLAVRGESADPDAQRTAGPRWGRKARAMYEGAARLVRKRGGG